MIERSSPKNKELIVVLKGKLKREGSNEVVGTAETCVGDQFL